MKKVVSAIKNIVYADFKLFGLVMILLLFGVGMVFSASYYGTLVDERFNHDPYWFLKSDAAWAAGGIFCMLFFSVVDVKIFKKIAPFTMILAVLLLVGLFTPLGMTLNGATRWYKLGPITVMPGEFAKIAVIWFTAWYYTKYESKTRQFKGGLLAPPLIVMGICAVLIVKQPNLSTALIVSGVILGMMFLAGVRTPYIIVTIAIGGLLVLAAIPLLGAEHLSRIQGYTHPFDDMQGNFYQTCQALLALGAGNVFGTGPGGSVQKALYLPESQTDYIFAIIGEEWGFVGCLLLMGLYLALIGKCMLICIHASTRFSTLVGSGITVMLALQVIMNIGIVTNLIPPTGVTLPFISFGGNAMILFMASMGIMQSISIQTSIRNRSAQLPPLNQHEQDIPRTKKTRSNRGNDSIVDRHEHVGY